MELTRKQQRHLEVMQEQGRELPAPIAKEVEALMTDEEAASFKAAETVEDQVAILVDAGVIEAP